VQLKNFSLSTATIEAELIFKAIETVISPSVIRETLSETGSCEERSRKLPSALVVCLVIAMNLWSSDAMGDVLKNLVSGLSRERLAFKPLCSSYFNVSSRNCCFHISFALRFHWYSRALFVELLLISKMRTASNYPFFLQTNPGNFGAKNPSKTGQNKS